MNRNLKKEERKTKHPPFSSGKFESPNQVSPCLPNTDEVDSSSSITLTMAAVQFLSSQEFLNNFEAVGSLRHSENDDNLGKENYNTRNVLVKRQTGKERRIQKEPSLMSLNKLLITNNSMSIYPHSLKLCLMYS